jgi:hypothetical protein
VATEPEIGRIGSADRATRPTAQAPAGLGDTASVPCADWTPGPWLYAHRETAVSEGYHSTEIFTEDGGSGKGVIATLSWYPRPLDERGAMGTYREANAPLIAAAPDLFEAVRLFLEYDAGDEEDGVALMLAYAKALDAAKAAFAKARGQQVSAQ